jgi:hypothetical protein
MRYNIRYNMRYNIRYTMYYYMMYTLYSRIQHTCIQETGYTAIQFWLKREQSAALSTASCSRGRPALQLASATDEWTQLSSGSQAARVHHLLPDGELGQTVEKLVELLHPFSDSIHQLEGD